MNKRQERSPSWLISVNLGASQPTSRPCWVVWGRRGCRLWRQAAKRQSIRGGWCRLRAARQEAGESGEVKVNYQVQKPLCEGTGTNAFWFIFYAWLWETYFVSVKENNRCRNLISKTVIFYPKHYYDEKTVHITSLKCSENIQRDKVIPMPFIISSNQEEWRWITESWS